MTGYLGNKGVVGAFQAIIAQMPPHDTYIETHLGSGVILRRKAPAAVRSIGIEIDPATVAQFGPFEGAEIHNGDSVAFLQTFDFAQAGRVLIYADPPYLLSTRASSGSRYRFDYTDADHLRLLTLLRSLPANVSVMISGYPSALYDVELEGWRSIEFQVSTRGGPRTEKVWMNFEAGAVHWVEYAGVDFGERQRIKRKATRWGNAFAQLNHGERLAVLAAILSAGATVEPSPYLKARTAIRREGGPAAAEAAPRRVGRRAVSTS